MEHGEYAEWDAAYVLGALKPSEREEYEAHLAVCSVCRAAVAELASLPGLLARVPGTRAEDSIAEGEGGVAIGVGPAHRATVLRLGAARVRRARRARWIVFAAASIVLIAGILIPSTLFSLPQRGQVDTMVLQPIDGASVSATVNLEDVAWGTRVSVECRYNGTDVAPDDGWQYVLIVIATDGTEAPLSSWRAFPETTAQVVAGTSLRSQDIAVVEVRSVVTGAVLLRSGASLAGG